MSQPAAKPATRAYAPDMKAAPAERGAGAVFGVILLVLAAFGGFLYLNFGANDREPPVIHGEAGPYRIKPDPEAQATAEPAADRAIYRAVEGEKPKPPPAAAPAFTAEGAWVAQLGAFRDELGAGAAWRALALRGPGLFKDAKMDVQRADLGASGVVFRLRAGYFASRADAARFCEALKPMGQDCIVAAR